MLVSLFLAKVISIYLLVVGLTAIIHHKRMKQVVDQVANSAALLALSGVLGLIIGLLIVNSHNIWSSVWQGIISLFGWLALVNGAARLLIPSTFKRLSPKGEGTVFFVVWGVILMIVGIYLGYVGFFYSALLKGHFA
jgi:Short repeat of unknown function (DUF308)